MINVTVKDKELRKMLEQAYAKTKDLRPLMTLFYGEMYKEIMLNFRLQGSYGDILSGKPSATFTRWKNLSPGTLAGRAIEGTGTAILQRSNRLRMSIGTVRKITNKSVAIGTDAIQSAAMHFGATIKPVRAKALTIPFPGVRGSARDYDNTFIHSGIIFQNLGKEGIKPLFSLHDKVKVPARPYVTIGTTTVNKFGEYTAHYVLGLKTWRNK